MSWLDQVIGYGTFPARPAAGSAGRLYYESDTDTLLRDNGSTWDALNLGSGGGGTHPIVALDYVETTDIAAGISLTASTWTDLGSNKNFTVSSAGPAAVLAICVRGNVFVGDGTDTGDIGSRLVVDSAGTPIIRMIGGGFHAGGTNEYVNVLGGTNVIFIAGLAAGVHTVKVQVWDEASGDRLYCRCSSHSNAESFSIQVVEY